MITNRKGLSDVVTTVLIILLVLAAVVIVGNYVLQLVSKGGEKIGGASVCGSVPVITPKDCKYTSAGTLVTLGLTAKKGGNNADIKGLKLILERGDKTTTTADITTIPKYSETSSITITGNPAGTAVEKEVFTKAFKKVSVAATINDSAQTVCPESKKIDCIG